MAVWASDQEDLPLETDLQVFIMQTDTFLEHLEELNNLAKLQLLSKQLSHEIELAVKKLAHIQDMVNKLLP